MEIIPEKEQRRVDLANQRIKIKRIMNVGVFCNGVLVKDGFQDAYSANNFMNDTFFKGKEGKRNFLNPHDFGWNVQLIEEKTEIVNIEEIQKILGG